MAYAVAGTGKPGFLAQLAEGVRVSCLPTAPLYPEDSAAVVTATIVNPWKAPLKVHGFRIWHVTMGEMLPIPPPERLKALPGPVWLDPAGVDLAPGQSLTGRLCIGVKKYEVSLPCALEATVSIGQPGRGGVLLKPIADIEEEARKAAGKAPAAKG